METTIVLKSDPGIKRDGTKYDGNNYTDGQWVRWQRGLPRKIGGYYVAQKYLSEISRGFSTFAQHQYVYCHSGSKSLLERFTLTEAGDSSFCLNRSPVGVEATGSVTLTGGSSGVVSSITVDGVEIMNGSVSYTTNLNTTATAIATSINTKVSVPDYTALAVGAIILITAAVTGDTANTLPIVATSTGITTNKLDMSGGSTALVVSDDNQWMFDYQFDSSTSDNYLIAHVTQSLSYLCNDTGGKIFYGKVLETTPLKSIKLPANANCDGGVVALHPYLFYYGTDGIIGWSVPGNPTNMTDISGGANLARVWGMKIIKGLPLRAGSGSAPAGIFWAWNAVIRATFVGGESSFQFDIVATETSIMSAASVVDYDGVFFWAGVDRFMMFNGVAREVENSMNLNYFFDGLNKNCRSKVFAFKVPRYGEIWWCYPRGIATECTHAVIYNVRENSWYDTELPNTGRSAGYFSNSFASPVLTGVEGSGADYKVWIHEQGSDEINGQTVTPITSFFETADLSSLVQGKDEMVRITAIEPDFVQSGNMMVQITGRANARSPEVYGNQFLFPATATTPQEQIVVLKEMRRELRARFESNAVGGDYQMGQIIAHIAPGDKNRLT